MNRKYLTISLFCIAVFFPAWSQGQHGEPMHNHATAETDSLVSTRLPDLNGSGTNWLPRTSPIMAYMSQYNEWMAMFHGAISLRYTDQNTGNPENRGENSIDGPNWAMVMLSRELRDNTSRISIRSMVSLDPLTEQGDGYPLLFQTGETWEGEPLVDRQHPHDLVMELSALFQHQLTPMSTALFYLAYPGEPALGPTTYMHRPSGELGLDAVLGHHNQDATHISFGVGTAGLTINNVKIEGSVFTGREPDENRWDFDKPRFDSYSMRTSWRPGTFEMQVSAGFINSPEAIHPDEDIVRSTASIQNISSFENGLSLQSTALYGSNYYMSGDESILINTALLETQFIYKRLLPYLRFEYVQRRPEDINIEAPDETVYHIGAGTVGLAADISPVPAFKFIAGVQSTMNVIDESLTDEYGNNPVSWQAYIKLTPPLH